MIEFEKAIDIVLKSAIKKDVEEKGLTMRSEAGEA